MSRLRLLITAIVLFAFAACGGASRAPAPRLPANTAAQLEALACPEGVDSALWMELKAALEEALHTKSILSTPGSPARLLSSTEDSRAEARRTGGWANHGRDARATKITATPPAGAANQIDDLTLADNGDGTYTLSWHYRNLGDYDQDGVVALEDIIPLAEHFGEAVPEDDAEGNSLQAVIDGSGNGRVRIEDITPIAQHFQTDVHHYLIEGAESSEGPWELVSEVQQDTGTGDGRLIYEHILSGAVSLWHRVVPYDAEGTPGEPSNAVLRPSNELIIYEVTPTEGYQHEACAFTATVSGAEPLTYAWDFGGGAEPDTSVEASPTVSLAGAGEYAASLTVTNAYGQASHLFTLTVNERDTWAHTWGTESNDYVGSLAVSEEGEVWVSGGGYAGDFLVKFSSSGEFQWAKRWESDLNCVWGELWRYPDGKILTSGSCRIPPSGYADVLLTEFSPDGELLRALVWGTTEDHEDAFVQAVDDAGNIYLAGSRTKVWAYSSVLLLKLDPDWNVMWAKVWGTTQDEDASGIVLSSGALYVCGSAGPWGSADTLLMKVSLDGEVLWAKTWDSGGQESLRRITFGPDGYVYAIGECIDDTGLIMKYSTDGNLLAVKGWQQDLGNDLRAVCPDPWGNLTIVGRDATGLMILKVDAELKVLESFARSPEEYADIAIRCAFDTHRNLYIVGNTYTLSAQWGLIPDRSFVLEGMESTREGGVEDLSATPWEPEGMMTNVTGVIDATTGSDDFLVLKNYPK